MSVTDRINFLINFVWRESSKFGSDEDAQKELDSCYLEVQLCLTTEYDGKAIVKGVIPARGAAKTIHKGTYDVQRFKVLQEQTCLSGEVEQTKGQDRDNLLLLYQITRVDIDVEDRDFQCTKLFEE